MTDARLMEQRTESLSGPEQARADLADLRRDTPTLQHALESREADVLHAIGNDGDSEERAYLRGRLAVARQMVDRHRAAIRAQEIALAELEEGMTEAATESLQQERDRLSLQLLEGDEGAAGRLEAIEAKLRQKAVQRERAEAAARARAQRDTEEEQKELKRRQQAAQARADEITARRRELAEEVDALAQELAGAAAAYLALCAEHQRELVEAGAGQASAHVARPMPDRLVDAIAWRLSPAFPGVRELYRAPGMRATAVEADPMVPKG